MLKSYIYDLQVSFNGGKWFRIDSGYTELREEQELERIFIENYSFSEAHKWISRNYHSHLSAEYTLFKKKPKIRIQYGLYNIETYKENSFNTISIRAVYEERSITMKELQNEDADTVIQYFKERGITTCPMNF